MAEPSTLPSTPKAIRQLVEQYTPDGTTGRLILAFVTGTASFFGVWMTAIILLAGTTLFALTVGPVAGLISVALLTITVLTLWPVYLSAIGRVESPTAYSKRLRQAGSRSSVNHIANAYRTGELTEEELEQQLETTLENDVDRSSDSLSSSQESLEPARE